MKKCTKCKEWKLSDDFYKTKKSKDGYTSACKKCVLIDCKNYRDKNKEPIRARDNRYKKLNKKKISIQGKMYREKNKEKLKITASKWRTKNREILLQKKREYYYKNKDKIFKKQKDYNKKNKEAKREYWRKYAEKRRKTDPNYKITNILRKRLINALRGTGATKKWSALKLLGCSIEFLRGYLEARFKSDMTWKNHGKVWQIDHIVPCAKFDLTDPEQQKQCFHYTNMRPLYSFDNNSKHDKLPKTFQIELV